MSVRLSAIVPTRDRPEQLREGLRALREQSLPGERFEVIVVDDGSTADLSTVVKEGLGPEVRLVRQEPAGLNAARNRGAEEAGGEVLAFLDDDAVAAPGWAAAVLAAFDAHGCPGLAGRVDLELRGPEPPWVRTHGSLLAELDLGEQGRWLGDDELPVGANCAIRRTELERLGGFRLGLDRAGGSLVSNGETDLFRRLRAAGGRLRYEPAARVVHVVPAERLTFDYFSRRVRAQGMSDELLEREEAGNGGWPGREAFRRGRAAPILAKGVLKGDGSASARLWVSYCRGRRDARRGESGA